MPEGVYVWHNDCLCYVDDNKGLGSPDMTLESKVKGQNIKNLKVLNL